MKPPVLNRPYEVVEALALQYDIQHTLLAICGPRNPSDVAELQRTVVIYGHPVLLQILAAVAAAWLCVCHGLAVVLLLAVILILLFAVVEKKVDGIHSGLEYARGEFREGRQGRVDRRVLDGGQRWDGMRETRASVERHRRRRCAMQARYRRTCSCSGGGRAANLGRRANRWRGGQRSGRRGRQLGGWGGRSSGHLRKTRIRT